MQVAVGNETLEAASREEPDMSAIEQSALVVVEPTGCNAGAWIPMSEVRHADQDRTAGRESGGDVGKQLLGCDGVLEDVGRDDAVVSARRSRRVDHC